MPRKKGADGGKGVEVSFRFRNFGDGVVADQNPYQYCEFY
jgi:hypothetical protein